MSSQKNVTITINQLFQHVVDAWRGMAKVMKNSRPTEVKAIRIQYIKYQIQRLYNSYSDSTVRFIYIRKLRLVGDTAKMQGEIRRIE